jgi:hypothetical protein
MGDDSRGLAASLTVVDLAKEREDGPAFIASKGRSRRNRCVKKWWRTGGSTFWSAREGCYFQAMGWKDQLTAHLAVDSQTGRLRGNDVD